MGMSQSLVKKIIQDRDGYIWIGTRDGLNRYDGNVFTIFNHRQDDSSSLADNIVNDIFEDINGIIWVATTNGLSRYDKLKNSFINYRHTADPNSISGNQIYSIAQDSQGQLWFSTMNNGLNRMEFPKEINPAKTKFIHFNCIQSDDKTIISNSIWKIFFDRDGTGWVGTQNGLCRISKAALQPDQCGFDRFGSLQNGVEGTEKRDIWNIFQDRKGNLWLISFTGMLDVIPAAELTKRPGQTNIIHVLGEINKITGDQQTRCLSILEDAEGYLWIGTDDYGVLRCLPEFSGKGISLGNLSWMHKETNKNKSLGDNTVYSIFRDKAGSIWIGTNNGVSIFHRNKENFNLYPIDFLYPGFTETAIRAIAGTSRYVAFGSAGKGILIYDFSGLKSFKLEDRFKQEKNLDKLYVNGLLVDHHGNLWVGATNGVYRFSLVDGSQNKNSGSSHFIPVKDKEKSLYSQIILSIAEDHTGKIWIGTGRGLNLFDPSSNEMKRITRISTSKETNSGDIIRAVFEDSRHLLWIGTDDGLLKYDSISKKPVRTEISNLNHTIKINSIFEYTDHTLWIGTNGNGLVHFNPVDNSTTVFSTQNGLPNDVIESIAKDTSGNLWLSTHKGLCNFSLRDSAIINYDIHDGLQSNEFLTGSSFTRNGILFFGNTKGINAFFPGSVRVNEFVPPIVMTDFKIFDRSVFTTDTVIRRKILSHETIILPYKQNNFSFEFAALNFINSEKNKYSFKLEGYDKKWSQSDSRRFISYTNLDPGNYILKVKASNNVGVWNEAGISYDIIIQPPFYKTWLFRFLLAMAITLVIFLINRSRIRNLEIRKQREIAVHSTQMKEQFLANMSHEIRTPLNAIVGMTRLLRDKSPKPDQLKYLDAIAQSSDNLLVIINDILDISKIEAGKIHLEKIPFNIRECIDGVYNSLRFKAEEKGLHFHYEVKESIPLFVLGDPVRLSQILINLAGNSIKFTEKGNVTVVCQAGGNGVQPMNEVHAEFSVIDSGVGIAEENLTKIFESFTQESSDTTRKFGGTGLGLAITKSLVEMHNGNISVNSIRGKGTTFLFSIPYEECDGVASVHPKAPLLSDLKKSLKNIFVLLVEDNQFSQVVARDTLEQEIEEVKIDIAENGFQALELVKRNDYDIVLMDIQMPEMNGYDATREIRKLDSSKSKVSIIAMTANALKEEVQHCFDAGMDEFIAKPFATEDLLSKMSKMIHLRSKRAPGE